MGCSRLLCRWLGLQGRTAPAADNRKQAGLLVQVLFLSSKAELVGLAETGGGDIQHFLTCCLAQHQFLALDQSHIDSGTAQGSTPGMLG